MILLFGLPFAIKFVNLSPSLKMVKACKTDFTRSVRTINQNLLETFQPVRYQILKHEEDTKNAYFLLKSNHNSTVGALRFRKQNRKPILCGIITYELMTSINLIYYLASRNISIDGDMLQKESAVLYLEYCMTQTQERKKEPIVDE
jgi:hypothetical protein